MLAIAVPMCTLDVSPRSEVGDCCWVHDGASTTDAPDAVSDFIVQSPSAPNHTVPAAKALCSPTLPSDFPLATNVILPPPRRIDTDTSPDSPEPNDLVSTALSDFPSHTAASSLPPTTPTRTLGRSWRHSS
ncbi:hypothetical protein GCM10029964_046620 [Kibdelosporangium lantanae]